MVLIVDGSSSHLVSIGLCMQLHTTKAKLWQYYETTKNIGEFISKILSISSMKL
jgi:hypothetical protein